MTQAKALALIADRYHEPDYIKEGLGKVFSDENLSVEFTEDVEVISTEALKGVQLLAILRDGMIWPEGYDKPYVMWMKPEQEKAIADFVSKGGGFLALHNVAAIYPKDGPYREVLGGHFISHPAVKRFTVRVVNREHPVTSGVEDYELVDEQHFLEYDTEKVDLLLRSISEEDGESAAGWAREYGNGRVCFLANGHTLEALQTPAYQTLLRNAVRWCLRLLDHCKNQNAK